VTAGVYLVSINRSRYSAVYGGGHAKTAFLHAAISAAAHQRQRGRGLKKKSATFLRLRRILENTVRLRISLSVYVYRSEDSILNLVLSIYRWYIYFAGPSNQTTRTRTKHPRARGSADRYNLMMHGHATVASSVIRLRRMALSSASSCIFSRFTPSCTAEPPSPSYSIAAKSRR
jgi:hypothetical protein